MRRGGRWAYLCLVWIFFYQGKTARNTGPRIGKSGVNRTPIPHNAVRYANYFNIVVSVSYSFARHIPDAVRDFTEIRKLWT